MLNACYEEGGNILVCCASCQLAPSHMYPNFYKLVFSQSLYHWNMQSLSLQQTYIIIKCSCLLLQGSRIWQRARSGSVPAREQIPWMRGLWILWCQQTECCQVAQRKWKEVEMSHHPLTMETNSILVNNHQACEECCKMAAFLPCAYCDIAVTYLACFSCVNMYWHMSKA